MCAVYGVSEKGRGTGMAYGDQALCVLTKELEHFSCPHIQQDGTRIRLSSILVGPSPRAPPWFCGVAARFSCGQQTVLSPGRRRIRSGAGRSCPLLGEDRLRLIHAEEPLQFCTVWWVEKIFSVPPGDKKISQAPSVPHGGRQRLTGRQRKSYISQRD